MAATPKAKKPSGLTISRSGNALTFSWKQGQAYSAQHFWWRSDLTKKDKKTGKYIWNQLSVAKGDTSKTVTLNDLTYGGRKQIYFKVEGKGTYTTGSGKKKKTHDTKWSGTVEKSYTFLVPNKPSLFYAREESTNNQGTFSWETSIDTASASVWDHWEYQTVVTSTADYPSNWGASVTGTAEGKGSVTLTESVTSTTRVRHFRVRSLGTAGASAWAYTYHVYGSPSQATISNVVSKISGSGVSTTIQWTVPIHKNRPVDSQTVQYCITVPAAGLTCPSGASWSDGPSYTNANAKDASTFHVDSKVGEDECLFLRIATKHDNTVVYSDAKLSMMGVLKDPEFGTIEVDFDTKKVIVNATNHSEVPNAYLDVYFRDSNGRQTWIGTIPSGSSSATFTVSQMSGGSYGFAIRAIAWGSGGMKMISSTITKDGNIPLAPSKVVLSTTDIPGTVRVEWNWTWAKADGAQIGWADHLDAWESTSEPSTYDIASLHAAHWNISDLETGQTWYIRVRLVSGTGESATYGPWSNIQSIDLSEAPTTPTLVLSDTTISEDGKTTAGWAYTSGDGTAQAYAEICEVTISGEGITYHDAIAHTTTAQTISLYPSELGWKSGTTHYLCVRVTSASGRVSENWSAPVTLTIAEKLSPVISSSSLIETEIIQDEITRNVRSLTTLPMTIAVDGVRAGETTTILIERAEEYHIDRPDESQYDGFLDETIARKTQVGASEILITLDDLIGSLDDGASYRLIAAVQDSFGQYAETSLSFEVHWDHQPEIPSALISRIAQSQAMAITPLAPDGAAATDTVDIYRLSTDPPELIVFGGSFGVTYVDPYPAFGEGCGHRIVCRTEYGDYITSENQLAWVDLTESDGDLIENPAIVIDFEEAQITLPYNIKLSNQWSKDFERTVYLGGSVQGDWNPVVTRDLSASVDVIKTVDAETIRLMRKLANFSGICHVRTPDGSSFPADIEVSESRGYDTQVVSFTLTICAVESEGYDGMTLAQWNEMQEELNGLE